MAEAHLKDALEILSKIPTGQPVEVVEQSGVGHHFDFDVPNIDAIEDQEDLEELEGVFVRLANYTGRLLSARIARRRGRIQDALDHEAIMDTHYKALPAWARW